MASDLEFLALDLPRNFKGQVQCLFSRFAADHGRLLFADAFDEVLEFQLERFIFGNWHGLANDFLAAEFANDGGVAARQGEELGDRGTFLLAIAGDAIDEAFLGAVIKGDVTGGGFAAAEHAYLAHSFGADPADSEIGYAAVGEAQARVGEILATTQNGNAHGIHTGHG